MQSCLCAVHCWASTVRGYMPWGVARNLKPAAELGMTTVWVRTNTSWAKDVKETDHIHHITDDLKSWLDDAIIRS